MSKVIDLSSLNPESKRVKLTEDTEITLLPGKLKLLIKIQKASALSEAKDATEQERVDAIDRLCGYIGELIPEFEEGKVDLTIPQIKAIVQLAFEDSIPKKAKNLKEAGMKPNQKKMTKHS